MDRILLLHEAHHIFTIFQLANDTELLKAPDDNTNKNLFILEDALTYLNCANMSPMLKSAMEAGLRALNTRAAPWNISPEDWFTNAERLRDLAAKIFKTGNNNVALIPSASYGLAVAAKILGFTH